MLHVKHRPAALPRVLLAVALAFPLGVLSALTDAIPIFATILPISIFLGLVLPIALPLVILGAAVLAARSLARTAARAVAHTSTVAYMGLYGVAALASSDPPPPSTETPPRRAIRPRLFIKNMPHRQLYASLPTPPWSSPSYTPSRSPTLTDDTDSQLPPTPVDEEPPFSRMSDMLRALDEEALVVVASYVDILRAGRKEEP